jgi:hypothetical protein
MDVKAGHDPERHPRGRLGTAILALGLIASLAAPAAVFAAKGGGASAITPWIALGAVDGRTALAAAQPSLGSSVAFATGYPTGTRNAWVSLVCYQDGVLVYGEGGRPSGTFLLGGGGSAWLASGGAATCKAELGDLYWRGGQQYYKYLAETWFDASA